MHPSRILLNEPPAMALVRQMLKTAMKSGNVVEKTTLRAVMSAVKNAAIDKPGSVASNVAFGGLLNSIVKKHKASIEEYLKGNRSDLADKEKGEMAVISKLISSLELSSPEQIKTQALKFLEESKLSADTKDGFKQAMSKLPKDIEEQWKAPKASIVQFLKDHFTQKRGFSTYVPNSPSLLRAHKAAFSATATASSVGLKSHRYFHTTSGLSHDNPLGLRRRSQPNQQTNKKARIANVRRVLLVSSAKGGVGKSTVAVNLALSLQKLGHSTGILDADIFGPSVPKMLGLEAYGEPRLSQDGTKLLPLIGHGLRAMSMGFLIPKDKSVSWRGLLVQKALHQLLFEVEWGPLDYLVVDMPPGTGDVQLTIGQQLAVDGAVVVTTPQKVAQIDAQRGLDLFRTLGIRTLGFVENMAHFTCPCCGTETRLFGPEPELGVPRLGAVPLEPAIAAQADAGAFEPREAYIDIARGVVAATE